MSLVDNSFVQSAIGGLVRHAAGFSGAWLLAHGVLTQTGTYTSYDNYVGSVCCLGAVIWSLFDKWKRGLVKL